MGIALKLLPQYEGLENCSLDVLTMTDDWELFEPIQALQGEKGIDCPVEGLSCYVGDGKNGEPAYGPINETPYGEKLKGVKAIDLKNLFEKIQLTTDIELSVRNLGIMSYVRLIPDNNVIYLFWN